MSNVVISGTGLFIPPHTITNDELVDAYNRYAMAFNEQHADAIASGQQESMPLSSSEFIEKASGIRSRYAMHKEGMLDIQYMHPRFSPTSIDNEPEVVTMGLAAARQAIEAAGIPASDIDLVIVTTTNHQRPYPSIAAEIQHKLGCQGHGYDMGIACSSATFGLINAWAAIQSGIARNALVVNPEFCTPQVNLKSRDSHFIFGDVATAAVLQREELATAECQFRIINTRQLTRYSTNIHCLGNYSDHCQADVAPDRPLFHQEGRKVFKELLPLVTDFIEQQLSDNQLQPTDLKRYWLHQANINMNLFAVKKLLGEVPANPLVAPIVLDEFANTASSGSVIAFHRYHSDFAKGEKGLICSFGAGYSIGSLLVERC